MKLFSKIAIAFLAVSMLVSPAAGQTKKLTVVCTLPTLKALAQEVGGDRVDVTALAKGDQDPHFVTPTPVLMKKTREAALFIENGFSTSACLPACAALIAHSAWPGWRLEM